MNYKIDNNDNKIDKSYIEKKIEEQAEQNVYQIITNAITIVKGNEFLRELIFNINPGRKTSFTDFLESMRTYGTQSENHTYNSKELLEKLKERKIEENTKTLIDKLEQLSNFFMNNQ